MDGIVDFFSKWWPVVASGVGALALVKFFDSSSVVKMAILPQSSNLHARTHKPDHIIVHTTGRGLLRKALEKNPTTPGEVDAAALDWYRGSGMAYYGTYLVGHGDTYRLALDEAQPAHAANITRGTMPWWRNKWGAVASDPVELLGDTYANGHTVGIDLLPYSDASFSDSQYKRLKSLLRGVCSQYSIPFDRIHILGHEDIDPTRRGDPAPWDPGLQFDWDRIFS